MDGIRRALVGGGVLALCWPATVLGQPTPRIARVVIANKLGVKGMERFRAEFAKHGWVDGRNLALSVVDVRGTSDGEVEARAEELVASRPDAIMVLASPEVLLFKRLTKDIPVVFYNMAWNPVEIGLVESLRRPGGNFTGNAQHIGLIWTKAWAALKEIRPAMKRGDILMPGVRSNFDDRFPDFWKTAKRLHEEFKQSTSSRLGIEIRDIEVPPDAPLSVTTAAIRKSKPDALMIWGEFPGLIPFLERSRIPSCGVGLEFAREGGLLGYAFDFREGVQQAIAIAARILRGESPATIPVYESLNYSLALNLRAARAMGLTVPASIRVQANEVIE